MKTRRSSARETTSNEQDKENVYPQQQLKSASQKQVQEEQEDLSSCLPPIKLLFRRESNNSYNVLRLSTDENVPQVEEIETSNRE